MIIQMVIRYFYRGDVRVVSNLTFELIGAGSPLSSSAPPHRILVHAASADDGRIYQHTGTGLPKRTVGDTVGESADDDLGSNASTVL